MLLKRSATLVIFSLFYTTQVFSQVGAEAQGGKMSLWLAVGIDQKIAKNWYSITDIGYGRHSDPDNNRFLKRQGLNVLTQDFAHYINNHWGFSLGIGYWKRYAYTDEFPFDKRAIPYEYRNEFRPYQRLTCKQQQRSINISHIIRTDYRFFYTEDLKHSWTTPFEFRLRYMESWNIPITKNKKNRIVLIDEILTAVDKYPATTPITGSKWSPYQFTENRFSVYYRRAFLNNKVNCDLGLMHQYWREHPGVTSFNVSYNLMFDIIIHEPFKIGAI